MLFAGGACGDDDGAAGDGGGGDGGGGSSDGPAGVTCPEGGGAPVGEDDSGLWPGDLVICGTIALPDDSQADRAIQLELYRVDDPGNEFLYVGTTTAAHEVHYRLHVEAGTYQVGARIDDDGDATIGTGDLEGFFDGTLAAPIPTAVDAAELAVTASRNDVHFGLGRR
jgi:hypothetical protein